MYYVKIALWSALWAAPLTVIGLLLCVTIVGIIPGVALIMLGAKPIAELAIQKTKDDVEKEMYEFRHGDNSALDECIDTPWLD